MLSKEEILLLLNKSEWIKLFGALHEYFKGENDLLNTYINKWLDPPGDFQQAEFATKLRLFIMMNYQPSGSMVTSGHISIPENPDFYATLCKLDFKLQTKFFAKIFRFKDVGAFLLHGDDKEGKDLRWLYNQLLHTGKLPWERHVIIDFDSPLGGSFDRLLEELLIAHGLDARTGERKDRITALQERIRQRLESGDYVCIVRQAEYILGNRAELDQLFTEFLSSLDTYLRSVRKKEEQTGKTKSTDKKNVLIFLFLEYQQVVCSSRPENCFTWFTPTEEENYAWNAATSEEFRIIDLGHIRTIQESDIHDWVEDSLTDPLLFNKLFPFKQQAADILRSGNRPYEVIESICTKLNIPIQQQWIQ